jgi:plastocyanin
MLPGRSWRMRPVRLARFVFFLWLAAPCALAGDLTGNLIFDATKPADGADKAAPESAAATTAAQAVVWVEGVKKERPLEGELRISQSGAKFDPAFLIVPTGKTVQMPNDDTIAHNVFSYSTPKQFNLGIYPKGETKSVVFDKPGKIDLFCSIHRHMHAVIFVVPTTWFAEADAESKFSIKGLPAGKYAVKAWRDGFAEAKQEVSIPETGELHLELKLTQKASS